MYAADKTQTHTPLQPVLQMTDPCKPHMATTITNSAHMCFDVTADRLTPSALPCSDIRMRQGRHRWQLPLFCGTSLCSGGLCFAMGTCVSAAEKRQLPDKWLLLGATAFMLLAAQGGSNITNGLHDMDGSCTALHAQTHKQPQVQMRTILLWNPFGVSQHTNCLCHTCLLLKDMLPDWHGECYCTDDEARSGS